MSWLIWHNEPRATKTIIQNKRDNVIVRDTSSTKPHNTTTFAALNHLPDSDQEMEEPADMSRGKNCSGLSLQCLE